MIWLASHRAWDEVGQLDPASGRLVLCGRASAPDPLPVNGHFCVLNGVLLLLFRANGDLCLQVADRRFNVDSDDFWINWQRAGDQSTLTLGDGSGDPVLLEYPPDDVGEPVYVNDPTAFSSPEDWDFGLFLNKVISDDAWRKRIYTESTA